MITRERTSSGGPFEERFGYCRAVRVGNQIHVSGTAAVEPDGRGDVRRRGSANGSMSDESLAMRWRTWVGSLADVVRVRIYITDIGQYEATGEHLRAAFGAHPPAATMVEVSGLIDPEMLVEIEVDAVIAEAD